MRVVYRSFAPPPEEAGLEFRRAALVQATPALLRAWGAMLSDVEPRLRGWLALRTGRDPGEDEVAVATAALLAVHRLLVESWDGADIDAYLDRADRALDLLARGLRSLDADSGGPPGPDDPPAGVSGG